MKEKLLQIKMILMDVDGVLTSGSIIYSSSGEELKEFNIHDGMGITLCHKAGIKTGIITARESKMVLRRAEELKYDFISQNSSDKLKNYNEARKKFDLIDQEICYIGDDFTDAAILKQVGFSVAVANARDEVKAVCDYVTDLPGGKGAVREVIDKILKAQKKLYPIFEKYS